MRDAIMNHLKSRLIADNWSKLEFRNIALPIFEQLFAKYNGREWRGGHPAKVLLSCNNHDKKWVTVFGDDHKYEPCLPYYFMSDILCDGEPWQQDSNQGITGAYAFRVFYDMVDNILTIEFGVRWKPRANETWTSISQQNDPNKYTYWCCDYDPDSTTKNAK